MELTEAAPWLAGVSVVLATGVAILLGWRAWSTWQRLELTRDAAAALLEVHGDKLDVSLQRTTDHTGTLAESRDRLAGSIAELRDDVTHLRWLMERVPEERANLGRELTDMVLPTDG